MTGRRPGRGTALGIAAALLFSGCTGADDADVDATARTATVTSRAPEVAPLMLDLHGGQEIPGHWQDAGLFGNWAVAPEGDHVLLLDGTGARRTIRVRRDGEVTAGFSALVDLAGRPMVVAPFVVEHGAGASRTRRAEIVVTSATGTGPQRRYPLRLPKPLADPRSEAVVGVAHIDGAVAAIRMSDQRDTVATVAVELGSGRELWRRGGVAPSVVTGGRIIGRAGKRGTVALDLRTGRRIWSSRVGGGVWTSGPRAVVVTTEGRLTVLDAATGKLLNSLDLTDDAGPSMGVWCVFDQVDITVCHDELGYAVAFDAPTGRLLWRSGRILQAVQTAWNGVVYLGGPGAADARSAEPLATEPNAVIYATNGELALGSIRSGGDTMVFRVAPR